VATGWILPPDPSVGRGGAIYIHYIKRIASVDRRVPLRPALARAERSEIVIRRPGMVL